MLMYLSKYSNIVIYDEMGFPHEIVHEEHGVYYSNNNDTIELYINSLIKADMSLIDDFNILLDSLYDDESVNYSVFYIPYYVSDGFFMLFVKIKQRGFIYVAPDALSDEMTFFTMTCIHNNVSDTLIAHTEQESRYDMERLFSNNFYEAWEGLGLYIEDPNDILRDI